MLIFAKNTVLNKYCAEKVNRICSEAGKLTAKTSLGHANASLFQLNVLFANCHLAPSCSDNVDSLYSEHLTFFYD